jgi:cytochrome c556
MKKMLLAASLSLLATGLQAEDIKPQKAIEYRQSVFHVMGWHFKTMGAMVKGEMPFNKETFAKKAEIVAFMSPLAGEGFIKGTSSSEFTESKAKAILWEKMEDVKAKSQDSQKETKALAEIAKAGDEKAIKEQFSKTAKTCKACHDDYREE